VSQKLSNKHEGETVSSLPKDRRWKKKRETLFSVENKKNICGFIKIQASFPYLQETYDKTNVASTNCPQMKGSDISTANRFLCRMQSSVYNSF